MSEVAAHTSSFAWEDADCPPPHPATSSASDATATVMAFGWCMGPPSRCPGAASSSRSDDELALRPRGSSCLGTCRWCPRASYCRADRWKLRSGDGRRSGCLLPGRDQCGGAGVTLSGELACSPSLAFEHPGGGRGGCCD